MIDKRMQAPIDAPLADPYKIYLPEGKRGAPRVSRNDCEDNIGVPKLSKKELAERKSKSTGDKLAALFDYYATTNLPAERVAEHLGLYRSEQAGVDDKGKPTFVKVLDVKRAEAQLSWRRKSAA